jgi:DNA-binding GntR family transcriptional regulator
MALEPLALTEALPRIDDELLDELESLVAGMREMDDRIEWLEANERFHGSLYAGSNSQRLLEMIDTLRKASRYYIHLFVVHECARTGPTTNTARSSPPAARATPSAQRRRRAITSSAP